MVFVTARRRVRSEGRTEERRFFSSRSHLRALAPAHGVAAAHGGRRRASRAVATARWRHAARAAVCRVLAERGKAEYRRGSKAVPAAGAGERSRRGFDCGLHQTNLFSPCRRAHRCAVQHDAGGISHSARAAVAATRNSESCTCAPSCYQGSRPPGRHAETLPWPGVSPEGRARGGNQGVCWFPPRSGPP